MKLAVIFASCVLATIQQAGVAAPAEEGPKWGFINQSGKLVIPAVYKNAKSFSEGVAAVQTGESWQFIDIHGKPVIDTSYPDAKPFSDGVAVVRLPPPEDLENALNSSTFGASGLKERQNSAPLDSEAAARRLAARRAERRRFAMRSSKWGAVDHTGKIVLQPNFKELHSFKDGLALSTRSGPDSGYIDKNGKIAIRGSWIFATDFSDGLAAVGSLDVGGISMGGGDGDRASSSSPFGFIDAKGAEVIPPQFNVISGFSEGLAGVALGSSQGVSSPQNWGYINKTGSLVIKPEFNDGGKFSEGVAPVQGGQWKEIGFGVRSWVVGKWGFIDKSGHEVVEQKFDDAKEFSDGLAAVKIGSRWGFIDKKGQLKIKPIYSRVGKFSNGLAPVTVTGEDLSE